MWFSGILNRNYGCYSDQIYVTASETIERHSVYEASAEIDKNVNTFSVKMKGECRHQKLRMIINLDCGMQERGRQEPLGKPTSIQAYFSLP